MGRQQERWTEREVTALRQAERLVGAEIDKQERWRQIAAIVGTGRSKRECYDKHKEMVKEHRERPRTAPISAEIKFIFRYSAT